MTPSSVRFASEQCFGSTMRAMLPPHLPPLLGPHACNSANTVHPQFSVYSKLPGAELWKVPGRSGLSIGLPLPGFLTAFLPFVDDGNGDG